MKLQRPAGTETEVLDRLTEFLRERSNWLLVALVPGIQHPNDGWDIVLRLDGTYFDREMAEDALDFFAKELGIDTPTIPQGQARDDITSTQTENPDG